MFAFIKGKLEEKSQSSVTLEVAGIGFTLSISNNTYELLTEEGNEEKLFTYLVVKEDNLSLIGFKTKEEKNLFLNLIEVSGVGPKAALQILSGGSLSYIVSAIASGNISALSKIKGVGKKTSERIVLELKEKLIKQTQITGLVLESENTDSIKSLPAFAIDACLGLESLGLSRKESEKLIFEVFTIEDTSAEELIAKALRRL